MSEVTGEEFMKLREFKQSTGLIAGQTIIGNKQPLYLQVAQSLRQRVRMGRYMAGETLPTVRALAREYQVSQFVVQRAVRILGDEGVLVSHQGKEMRVKRAELCRQAAIVFGLIQPFTTPMQLSVLQYAEQAFGADGNFLVIRGSQGDGELEWERAQHLVHNGIGGLIVWPVQQSPNGRRFQELSARIPLVLLGRLIEGSDLPAVVLDSEQMGRDIAREMLGKCKRVLMLFDRHRFSTYVEMMDGLREAASDLGREADLTIEQDEVLERVLEFGVSDFSHVDQFANRLEQKLRGGGYDGFFCPQSDLIDYIVVQTGMAERLAGLQMGTVSNPRMNTHSRQFCESRIIQWQADYAGTISRAAHLLRQWLMLREIPKGVVRIPYGRVG